MTPGLFRASRILCILLLAACASQEGDAREPSDPGRSVERGDQPRRADSIASTAGVIDSARTMSVLIDRFRQEVPEVVRLEKGAPSRDSLARALVSALTRRDTAGVARLFISRGEFAWLYFPASTLARPPYEIDPAFAWFQLSSESERGVHKALGLLGGSGAAHVSTTCNPQPVVAGAVRIWSACSVRWRSPAGAETEAALFASIIEHAGRFKIFSYSNRL